MTIEEVQRLFSALAVRERSQSSANLVSVKPRQADIDHDSVRSAEPNQLDAW